MYDIRWSLAVVVIALILCAYGADHYETLQVPRTATKSEIRRSFQKLSKQWYVAT